MENQENGSISVEMEPLKTAVDGAWIMLKVSKVHVAVEKKFQGKLYTVNYTKEVPEGLELVVVHQRYPGAETQPEDTITEIEVQDIIKNMLREVENSIDEVHLEKTQEKGAF